MKRERESVLILKITRRVRGPVERGLASIRISLACRVPGVAFFLVFFRIFSFEFLDRITVEFFSRSSYFYITFFFIRLKPFSGGLALFFFLSFFFLMEKYPFRGQQIFFIVGIFQLFSLMELSR